MPRKRRKNITTFDDELSEKLLSDSFKIDFIFYCILKMLGFTGIRPIDLLKLKIGDLVFHKKIIRVKSQRPVRIGKFLGKTTDKVLISDRFFK